MSSTRLGAARREAAERLAEAGLEASALEARMLVEAATGLSAAAQAAAPERPLSETEQAELARLTARRAAGEPLQHILGRADFWTLRLKTDARALVPRGDTETIVAAALETLPAGRAARVLDLGTGSGAILLAVLSERPRAEGLGVDASAQALTLAAENAALTGLAARAAFAPGDWTQAGWAEALAAEGPFDLAVSNPPYIRSADMAGLDRDVLADPHGALDGGADGLDAYRALLPALPGLLAPGGAAVFEIGSDQDGDIARLAEQTPGLALEGVRPDLEGRPRAAVFRAPGGG